MKSLLFPYCNLSTSKFNCFFSSESNFKVWNSTKNWILFRWSCVWLSPSWITEIKISHFTTAYFGYCKCEITLRFDYFLEFIRYRLPDLLRWTIDEIRWTRDEVLAQVAIDTLLIDKKLKLQTFNTNINPFTAVFNGLPQFSFKSMYIFVWTILKLYS